MKKKKTQGILESETGPWENPAKGRMFTEGGQQGTLGCATPRRCGKKKEKFGRRRKPIHSPGKRQGEGLGKMEDVGAGNGKRRGKPKKTGKGKGDTGRVARPGGELLRGGKLVEYWVKKPKVWQRVAKDLPQKCISGGGGSGGFWEREKRREGRHQWKAGFRKKAANGDNRTNMGLGGLNLPLLLGKRIE